MGVTTLDSLFTMTRIASLAAFPAIVLVAGCANLEPLPTPTGKPEVMINTTDTTKIKGALVATFAANGYSIAQDTPYNLVLTKPMEGSGAALYQAALGNAYSSNPQINISLTFAPAPGATRVFAHANISMQNAFGQNNATNMDQGKGAHQIQQLLENVKAEVEASKNRQRH